MLLANRQAQYKYSATGIHFKQENQQGKQNFKKGQFTFWTKVLKMGLVIGVLGVIIIFYVNQYAQMSTLNDQIYDLKKELNTLNTENEKVSLQISENNSLAHIEKEARERLGLVEPKVLFIPAKDTADKGNSQTKPVEGESKLDLFASGVSSWFKNLTSVEAGTLDE